MKSYSDPRHIKRREIVKELFAESYTPQQNNDSTVEKILEKSAEMDVLIEKAAPSWPTDKLNKIDLCILRLAIYELGIKSAPPKVIIDEAVELAKEFGSENSPSFVNGVLGTVIKDMHIEVE